jgi:Flp pilus assembly protein protease CpaA
VDSLLGFATALFFFVLLLFAASRDSQTREVTNWVWLIGLLGIPFTIYRLGTAGLLLLYGLQMLIVFFVVIVSFGAGILGGADGKTVVIVSLLYPWIFLNPLWLLVAPMMVLFGGFLLLGVHGLWLLLRNLLTWNQVSKSQGPPQKPEKKIYWVSWRFSAKSTQIDQWKQVDAPLVVYFFMTYTLLLIFTSALFYVSLNI